MYRQMHQVIMSLSDREFRLLSDLLSCLKILILILCLAVLLMICTLICCMVLLLKDHAALRASREERPSVRRRQGSSDKTREAKTKLSDEAGMDDDILSDMADQNPIKQSISFLPEEQREPEETVGAASGESAGNDEPLPDRQPGAAEPPKSDLQYHSGDPHLLFGIEVIKGNEYDKESEIILERSTKEHPAFLLYSDMSVRVASEKMNVTNPAGVYSREKYHMLYRLTDQFHKPFALSGRSAVIRIVKPARVTKDGRGYILTEEGTLILEKR